MNGTGTWQIRSVFTFIGLAQWSVLFIAKHSSLIDIFFEFFAFKNLWFSNDSLFHSKIISRQTIPQFLFSLWIWQISFSLTIWKQAFVILLPRCLLNVYRQIRKLIILFEIVRTKSLLLCWICRYSGWWRWGGQETGGFGLPSRHTKAPRLTELLILIDSDVKPIYIISRQLPVSHQSQSVSSGSPCSVQPQVYSWLPPSWFSASSSERGVGLKDSTSKSSTSRLKLSIIRIVWVRGCAKSGEHLRCSVWRSWTYILSWISWTLDQLEQHAGKIF